MTRPLRVATRKSALAQWQARHVATLLGGAVELVLTETSGDVQQSVPISEIGGKGVFVKEVQAAVLDGRADLAVHSAKDLPAATPDGLVLASIPERGDPFDALVGARFDDLPHGAVVATGSARRQVQLANLRPDLRFEQLRGNIATRLSKAPAFDAIVMAAIALERLDEHPAVVDVLDATVMVPQVGQGALAIECRADDDEVVDALAAIQHPPTRLRVDAERAFLSELGGDCDLPAGAFAELVDEGEQRLRLTGVLSAAVDRPDTLVRLEAEGRDPDVLGSEVARQLRRAVDS